MAEATTSEKQRGLTRRKAITIAVLAVVLVVVLYVQFGMSNEKTNSALVGYRPQRAAASQPTDSTAKHAVVAPQKKPTGNNTVSAPIIDQTRWKSPTLTTVVAYDPFALPPAFPQPPRVVGGSKSDKAENLIAAAAADDAKKMADAVEKIHMELEELAQRGVHVIVRDRDGYAAMIGDRMLHVGDKINEFTVTAIDPDGVHVERKESR